jgi:protein-tyrosine phosphatase
MITDLHTHILPKVDDGSSSLEESITMLQAETKQGIHRVIATPHFYAHHDTPEQFLSKRKAAYERLLLEMEKYKGLPELRLGAEVYYFPGISESEILQDLTISGTRIVMIEMPMAHWTDRMYRELEDISCKQGLTPVVAHVDRYIAPFATHGIPGKLAQLPVLVQANAEFFIRKSTRALAMKLLKADCIHLLGSDGHNMQSRSPNLGDAIQIIRNKLGEYPLERICEYEREFL